MLRGTEAHIHIFKGTTRHSLCPSAWMPGRTVLANIAWWDTSLPHCSSRASLVGSVLLAPVGKGSSHWRVTPCRIDACWGMSACATAHEITVNSRQAWGKSRNNLPNWSEECKKSIAVLKADTETWNNYSPWCCCSFRSGFNVIPFPLFSASRLKPD